ncbi:SDR family oxidoreductase [Telluribacter sp. SYSU D00476]|uniref:SDR family oxidoreductase n=1 Tax=Telluribacter sp. SYSU D00476 TaxID=2811430 RepID=UPI001FF5825A|nr:SDR family oxidoreductase [Telluribacter sp. SYSU D00476]
MNLAGNTILITGGASGIGLALAERFLQAGSEVIICGRREDKLQEARQMYPTLHTRVCDLAQESERVSLVQWVCQEFPHLNVVINNAGIQKRTQLINTQEEWTAHQQEIAINLEAPIHLSMLSIPLLRQQPNAVLINITSGLAFAPAAFAPIYSATKAALHSFTLSLRHQLLPIGIQVVEIAPPAVNTDLGGPGLHTFGAPLDDFADAVMQRLQAGELEIGYGTSEIVRNASRAELNEAFSRINSR